jgi:Predicted protein-tyrosine phosphatase
MSKWEQISKLEEWLYLGGIPSMSEKQAGELIERYNFDIIITINDREVNWKLPKNIAHFILLIRDSLHESIFPYLDFVSELLKVTCEKGKKVFIHCRYGISRSVSLVAAYYLRYGKSQSVKDALSYIKEKRPYIKPWKNFIDDLIKFSQTCSLHSKFHLEEPLKINKKENQKISRKRESIKKN